MVVFRLFLKHFILDIYVVSKSLFMKKLDTVFTFCDQSSLSLSARERRARGRGAGNSMSFYSRNETSLLA